MIAAALFQSITASRFDCQSLAQSFRRADAELHRCGNRNRFSGVGFIARPGPAEFRDALCRMVFGAAGYCGAPSDWPPRLRAEVSWRSPRGSSCRLRGRSISLRDGCCLPPSA